MPGALMLARVGAQLTLDDVMCRLYSRPGSTPVAQPEERLRRVTQAHVDLPAEPAYSTDGHSRETLNRERILFSPNAIKTTHFTASRSRSSSAGSTHSAGDESTACTGHPQLHNSSPPLLRRNVQPEHGEITLYCSQLV